MVAWESRKCARSTSTQHAVIFRIGLIASCLPHAEHPMATDDLTHAVHGPPETADPAASSCRRAGKPRIALLLPAVLQHEAGAHKLHRGDEERIYSSCDGTRYKKNIRGTRAVTIGGSVNGSGRCRDRNSRG